MRTTPNEGEGKVYAVGHLALGYVTGKAAGKLLNLNPNIPLLFLVSIIPDIDLLIGLKHRGPTHSIIILSLLFLPAFVFYRKKAIAYFAALVLHPLLGDGLTGGAQLLWPVTTSTYGIELNTMSSPVNILTEWILFLATLTLLLKTRDIHTLFKPHRSNLLLLVPIFTVLPPTLCAFHIYVPLELLIPHLIYLTLFALSIFIDFKALLKKR